MKRRQKCEWGTKIADYFASNRSWRIKPFYAKFGSGESKGIDACAMDWSVGFGNFHPPMGLIRKAEKSGASGLLVAPDWLGSLFCMLLEKRVKEGKMTVVEI